MENKMNRILLTKKECKRYNELYDKAINRYLDKTDFDVCEWLIKNESEELQRLMDKEQGIEE